MNSKEIEILLSTYIQKDEQKVISELKEINKNGKESLFSEIKTKLSSSSPSKKEIINYASEHYSDHLLEIILKHELNKPYKYSAIYNYEDSDNFLGKIKDFNLFSEEESVKYDNSTLYKPHFYENEHAYLIKFNDFKKGADIVDNKMVEREGILPRLIVIHKKDNIIEFRVSKIAKVLQNSEYVFYQKRLNELIDWVEGNTSLIIKPLIEINLKSIEDSVDTDVKVHAKRLDMHTGSTATLDSGQAQDINLPILGELKSLIEINHDTFDDTHPFYKVLEDFIQTMDEESDLPWMSLNWTNDIKSKELIVKFRFDNFVDKDYILLDYQKNNAGMEEMLRVSKYVYDNGTIDSALPTDDPIRPEEID